MAASTLKEVLGGYVGKKLTVELVDEIIAKVPVSKTKTVVERLVTTESGTFAFCNGFKKWLPLSSFSHTVGEDGTVTLKSTESKEYIKGWNDAQKAYKATKDAVFQDMLKGELSPADGQAKLTEAEKAKADAIASIKAPEGATEEKPA